MVVLVLAGAVAGGGYGGWLLMGWWRRDYEQWTLQLPRVNETPPLYR